MLPKRHRLNANVIYIQEVSGYYDYGWTGIIMFRMSQCNLHDSIIALNDALLIQKNKNIVQKFIEECISKLNKGLLVDDSFSTESINSIYAESSLHLINLADHNREALMRKVVLFNMVTLDGFFAGPEGEIDWHHVDQEFNEFAIEQLNTAGSLIFGRLTYQLMSSYWPTPAAKNDDPIVAEMMNQIPKYVFSRTLVTADWENTRLVKEDPSAEIPKWHADADGGWS